MRSVAYCYEGCESSRNESGNWRRKMCSSYAILRDSFASFQCGEVLVGVGVEGVITT